jgi:uncharacterized protein (DUF2062 family)
MELSTLSAADSEQLFLRALPLVSVWSDVMAEVFVCSVVSCRVVVVVFLTSESGAATSPDVRRQQ